MFVSVVDKIERFRNGAITSYMGLTPGRDGAVLEPGMRNLPIRMGDVRVRSANGQGRRQRCLARVGTHPYLVGAGLHDPRISARIPVRQA